MIILTYIYKIGKRGIYYFRKMYWIIAYLKFKLNRVNIPNDFITGGVPFTCISLKSKVSIGCQFQMNNGAYYNVIGRQQSCIFRVDEYGELTIGNNVGMSATAIVCSYKITIEDGVKIGGGTVIYDTDFHSLNLEERSARPEVFDNVTKKPVLIKKNAFIGANSTILKGVVIGENSVVGACSVITKSIPDNELWAGNPAQFVRKLN